MKKLFLLIFSIFASAAHSADAIVYNEIPCKGLPKEAITEIPDLLAGVGKIVCTPYGQMMEPHEGYWWPYNNIQPVLIPAQKNTKDPERDPNKFYFTDFSVIELKGEEKQKWLDKYYDERIEQDYIMSHSDTAIKDKRKQDMIDNRAKYMAGLQKDLQVYHMVALSSDGFARDIYFYKTQSDGVVFGLTYMADKWRLFGIAKIYITDHLPL